MLNTLQIFEELKEEMSETVALKIANAIGRVYFELANMVTKTEFNELKNIVGELAEAQKRTEQRVEELAEAQKRTEQKVEELAEAQKRTEQRVEELAEAQKRTEQKVEELAEAQKRTEQELKELVAEHKKTRQQLGGLTHTVGYILEDRAYVGLPSLLKRDFAFESIEYIRRDFIEIGVNKYAEVNVIGRATKDNKPIWIIGECKTQLKKSDIDDFLKTLKQIEGKLHGDRVLVIVTYQTSPQVRQFAEQKGIKLYFSYELNVQHFI